MARRFAKLGQFFPLLLPVCLLACLVFGLSTAAVSRGSRAGTWCTRWPVNKIPQSDAETQWFTQHSSPQV